MNLNYMKLFTSPNYRPVWRALPSQPEWQRVQGTALYEPSYSSYYKYSWTFEVLASENDYFFSFAPPFPYSDVLKSMKIFEKSCLSDTYFYRENIIQSIDGRNIELITISNKSNFSDTNEASFSEIFTPNKERCLASTKPIVFITARVHPAETPASFLLDSFIRVLISSDPRAIVLRNSFVFKIIPILNPDGVFRGNFRVDQNGINLNRCYINPSRSLHPSIFAAKTYFQYLSSNIKYYFDFHAHSSKRSCFLFGNSLEHEKQIENQLLAKLIEVNTSFFEYGECDFSEKSMVSKDPKDHHSKEGSGRVALYKSSGITHCYTIECSYYIFRPLHPISPAVVVKTGKKFFDSNFNDFSVIFVYNRAFFVDFASAILFSLLDMEKLNPISRLPSSNFRYLEAAREWVRAKIMAYNRIMGKNNFSKLDMLKTEKKNDKNNALPRIPARKVHKMNLITPIFNEIPGNNNGKIMFSLGRAKGVDNMMRFKSVA